MPRRPYMKAIFLKYSKKHHNHSINFTKIKNSDQRTKLLTPIFYCTQIFKSLPRKIKVEIRSNPAGNNFSSFIDITLHYFCHLDVFTCKRRACLIAF